MYLNDLWTKNPKATFRVSNCPWLVGTMTRASQSSISVRFKSPNVPYGDDGKPPEEPLVGNWGGLLSISPYTEVIEL